MSDGEYSSYKITQATDPSSILWETIVGYRVVKWNATFSSITEIRFVQLQNHLVATGLCMMRNPIRVCPQNLLLYCRVWYRQHCLKLLASFVIPDQVTKHGNIPSDISATDVLSCFKGWKESTSTSPSGSRHLVHYKALILHPTLLQCSVQFMNIVVARGIAIPR
jgi:hypothetical protein